ncbi:MAG: hypothetical protein WBH04_10235 [Albidovulum sp.]
MGDKRSGHLSDLSFKKGHKMKRQITAFVTALALAITSLPATQVEARDKKSDDTLGIIIGVGALALLLSQANKNKNQQFTGNSGRGYYDDDDWQNRGPQKKHKLGRKNMNRGKVIPAKCVREVSVNGRWRDVVSARCVDRLGSVYRLPQDCSFRARTGHGPQQVYGTRCLRGYGFRIGNSGY